jgi:release factor glutamine methyltransferase
VAATQRLRSAGLETPRLDGEVLLAHVLGWTRTKLYTYPDRPLDGQERTAFESLVERRFKHEPIAYLVGTKAFYGLDLMVDRRVLIPRPETELLVDLALDLIGQITRQWERAGSGNGHGPSRLAERITLADVGTGSGAISVAVTANHPSVSAYAIDISQEALDVARENAVRLGLADRVEFIHGDLLAQLPQPVDLVIANLPYVARHEWNSLAPGIAHFEPSLALSGGADGLAVIKRLLAQSPKYLRAGGAIILEIGSTQGAEVAAFARSLFPDAFVEVMSDYGYHDRVVRVQT